MDDVFSGKEYAVQPIPQKALKTIVCFPERGLVHKPNSQFLRLIRTSARSLTLGKAGEGNRLSV